MHGFPYPNHFVLHNFPAAFERTTHLKKVLALVLAFACAFTMFAGAAFSDQADIQSTEAVDALTGLGVIQGYTDGSFRPDVTVTRAEMAKMIFTILNGGNDDASAYENLPTSFTDLNDDWYKGYIKYLQNSGIIAGKSATRFAPNETVTGVEAAKMLLVVAGYDADKAGLTGLSWMANTMKYANLNNLFEDVDADVNAGLPRQYAAQIMYNSLDMERVVYSNDIGDFKPAEDVKDDATIGAKYLDLKFYGKDADESVVLYGTEKEANRDTYSLTTSGDDFTRVANDYSDLVGQRVVIMHKVGKTNEVYGVYAYEDSTVVATGYAGQLEADGDDKAKLDGTSYKLAKDADELGVYYFGKDTASVMLDEVIGYAKDDGTAAVNNVAQPIKLIDNNGDGKVDVVMTNPVKFGQVSYVGTSSMTVTGIGSLKYDDISGYEDIAKDDYVFVVDDAYNSTDKDIVTKADITSATIDATRTNEARVDGTWYRLSAGVTSVTTGSSYDMVICGNYILSADETKGSLEEVALLSAVKTDAGHVVVDTAVGSKDNEGTVEARMYFANGTNASVDLSKYDGDALVAYDKSPSSDQVSADTLSGKLGLVTYSKLADGTYDIKLVAEDDPGTSGVNEENLAGCDALKTVATKKVDDSKIDGMLVNDDAILFVEAISEIKVLTGAAVKSWDTTTLTANSVVLTETKNGLSYVAAGYLTVGSEKVPGATSDTKYGYLTANPYLVKTDDGNKATYEVWTSEGAKTLTADTATRYGVAGEIIAYTINGDFVDVSSTVYNSANAKAAIIGTNNEVEGVAELKTQNGPSKTYSFDEDCVFVAIDASEKEGAEGGIGSIPTAEEVVDASGNVISGSYYANAYVIFNADGDKIVAVFFDNSNRLSDTDIFTA